MAEKGKGRTGRSRRTAGPRVSRRRLRLLWGVVIVAAAVYLYYRPLSSYFDTRRDLAARNAEVETLREARSALQLRLVSSTSVRETEREARRLGFVRPGEQLFVVRGISDWRQGRVGERADSER